MAAAELHDVVPVPPIRNGTAYIIFAYDAARTINLAEAERRVHES